MEPQIYKMYMRASAPKNLRISYDQTGERPAWIHVRGLPGGANVIHVRWNKERILYMTYLPSLFPFFTPADHTHEELRKYYDRCANVYHKTAANNLPAAQFLLNKVKLPSDSSIVDLGAGTGFCAVFLANAGYQNITLVDYSLGMLEQAKKNEALSKCTFVHSDIRALKLDKKFDLIVSAFSFASDVYFNAEEMSKLWKTAAELLTPNGMLALIGYEHEPPDSLFKKIESGYYDITGKKDNTKWYIGKKK